eukprot:GGOE01020656.1.p1 GENE.GGOE01020656.1~~GGOE01020656.1.p1  ORF type:complete len:503 (+),score=144.33 GGOE01020656.1:57-1565(+)
MGHWITAKCLAAIGLIIIIIFSQIKEVGTNAVKEDHVAAGDKALLQGRGSYEDAIKHYTAALGILPKDQLFKVYYKRADVYQLLKKYEEALEDLNRLVQLKPNKSAFVTRIKVNTLLGNFAAVAEDFMQLMAVDAKKLPEHQTKAVEFQNLAAQFQFLKEQLSRLQEGHITDPRQRQDIYRQCVPILDLVQTHAKGLSDLALLKVECALGISDHNTVRTEVNRLLERNPNHLKALYFKAKSLNMMGAVDAARSHIRKCLTIDQEFTDCVNLHKQVKTYEKAKKAAEEAMGNRQWEDALKAVDEANAIDPEGPESNAFRRKRCELFLHLRKVAEGLQACTLCIEAEGDNPNLLDIYLLRADIHILNDDLDAAQSDVAKAREFDQRSQKVHEKEQNLARLRKMAERKDYYKILGIRKTATEKDIKAAYRKLAMQWHPDKTQNLPDDEKERAQTYFRDIAEAKEVLCDEEKRAKYDRGEDLNPQPQQQHQHFHHFGGPHFQFHFG